MQRVALDARVLEAEKSDAALTERELALAAGGLAMRMHVPLFLHRQSQNAL